MKIKTFGEVSNGKLVIYNRGEFVHKIVTCSDCAIELTIAPKHKGRSNPQNRYYWGCVLPIIKQELYDQHQVHYDTKEIHEFLKLKVNSIELVNIDGLVERLPTSTAELNTSDFEVFLELVRRWAYEFLDVNIPKPNEQLTIEL